MAGKAAKLDSVKCRGKHRVSPERIPGANEELVSSIREMMDEMRSDVISNFNSVVSDTVKREITAVLEPFERRMGSLGETVTGLERAANCHSDHLDELQSKVNKLTDQVESLSKNARIWRDGQGGTIFVW